MTRFAAIADVHLGNHARFGGPTEASLNRRAREGLDVLDRAVKRAGDLGCSALAVLGDLFDGVRPEPQLIAAAQRIFAAGREQGMNIFVLVGNHDQASDAAGDHALGPLDTIVEIIERPSWVMIPPSRGGAAIALGLIPFRRGVATDWLPEVIDGVFAGSPGAVTRVLGVHLGISDGATAPWLRRASDSIDVEVLRAAAARVKVRAVLAGNWHDRRFWRSDVAVLQLGALVPTGFDNPGLDGYGTLAVFDDRGADEGITFEEIPGPRFVKLGLGQTLDTRTPHRLYVSATSERENLAAVSAALGAARSGGQIVEAEVLPDRTETVVAARAAAGAAKAAGTLDEALAAFVAEMPMPPHVERDDVHARARAYLKVGRL